MSKNIESRIKRIEDGLGTSKGPHVLEIVYFADPLPPERTENGITYRYISFDSIRKGGI
ncbi:MAG: hypothetical protein WC454_06480 [Phycisphaerae bacterium]|jgi:hypothetical protein